MSWLAPDKMRLSKEAWTAYEPLLRRLWRDGLSCSQIAARIGLGVTRNAVIGKVHRLKLHLDGIAGEPARRPQAARAAPSLAAGKASPSAAGAPQRVAARTSLGKAVGFNTPKVARLPPREAVALQESAAAGGVSFADWQPGQCLFALGDLHSRSDRFCGAPAEPGANGAPSRWCGHHAGRVFANPLVRR